MGAPVRLGRTNAYGYIGDIRYAGHRIHGLSTKEYSGVDDAEKKLRRRTSPYVVIVRGATEILHPRLSV